MPRSDVLGGGNYHVNSPMIPMMQTIYLPHRGQTDACKNITFLQLRYNILLHRVFQERQPEGHDHRDEGSVEPGGRIDGRPEEPEHGGTEPEGRAGPGGGEPHQTADRLHRSLPSKVLSVTTTARQSPRMARDFCFNFELIELIINVTYITSKYRQIWPPLLYQALLRY